MHAIISSSVESVRIVYKVKSIYTALRGKGLGNFLRRGTRIAGRYGLTPRKMDRALAWFAAVLEQFQCGATFPITAVALERNAHIIAKYLARDIEFAVHGYRHIDHSQLSQAEQLAQLARARQIFAQAGIQPQGFRCPYLRGNVDTWASLRQQGFVYDSSQGLAWDVVDGCETLAYRHVLSFYAAKRAGDYPSLPRMEAQLVRIPYGLPDDEAFVERLDLETAEQMSALWLAILDRTWESGELFTLGLHPERIAFCQEALTAVLAKARSLTPSVWIARLDQIASWWQARARATVQVTDVGGGRLHLAVAAPGGTTVLVRAVHVDAPAVPWADGYRQVRSTSFTVHAPLRPFIGLSPSVSPRLAGFLRQQGYIVEISPESALYAYYFDQTNFAPEHERSTLARIERTGRPLVRLGRWPKGAHSALAITGDIDALTLWDYGLRSLER